MVQRHGGNRRGTRQVMRKTRGLKGKVSLRKYLQIFKPGDKVALVVESAINKGIYHKRFHGKIAVVTKRQGFCYEVKFNDKNKEKRIIVHPIHLKKIE